ncbi:MAG: sialidase family protein [Armatimonadota bacterium]
MISGDIYPAENWHNHASCIVELPDGDMLVCWYHGSGERTADDVLIEGSRFDAESGQWSGRFLMADTPDYPDCNPCMFVDAKQRLWLVYVTILANEWHTALLKYRTASKFDECTRPPWEDADTLHATPGDEFIDAVSEMDYSVYLKGTGISYEKIQQYKTKQTEMASDKLTRRLGWMPRARGVLLSDGRLILPLYSDGFDFSLMLISDDDGTSWHTSRPIISCGGVQPSVVERNDGTLLAFMRNNGPAPKKIMVTTSTDRGETWSQPGYTDLPNPGSGIEAIRLKSGRWLMIYNDTESGRHRLALALSDDEGETWELAKCLENDDDIEARGGYSYPSMMQASDGGIWVTYSTHISELGSTIRWARFDEEWLSA